MFDKARRAWAVMRGKPLVYLPNGGNDFQRMIDHFARRYANGYDAGSTGRLREDWGTSTGLPYDLYGTSRTKIVARSRKLYVDDYVYRAAINSVVANVVGAGLFPKPKVRLPNGDLNAEINTAIENAFWKYSKRRNWDSREKYPFIGDGQRLILKTALLSGDVFMNAVAKASGGFKIAWQLFEIDRLDDAKDMYKNTEYAPKAKETKYGINLDEYGKEISYNIKGIEKPIPANNIIHAYMTDRPEQHTGMPAAISALTTIFDSHDLKEDFVLKSRAISKILWFLSNRNYDNPGSSDTDENNYVSLDPLSQMRGDQRPDDIRFPDNVNDTIQPLVRLLSHGICASLGTSYTSVMRDMEGVNFAASKWVGIQEQIAFRVLRDWFTYDVCAPFYEKAVEQFVLMGMIPGLSFAQFVADYDNYTEADWVGSGREDVDPLKDMSADIEAVRNKILTYEDVWSKRGYDSDDQLKKLKNEMDAFDKAGLVHPANESSENAISREIINNMLTKTEV